MYLVCNVDVSTPFCIHFNIMVECKFCLKCVCVDFYLLKFAAFASGGRCNNVVPYFQRHEMETSRRKFFL